MLGALGRLHAPAGELKDAPVALVPGEGELARFDSPALRGANEAIGVIPAHCFGAFTLIVRQIVLRLHVGNAERLVAVHGDDVVGDHVLRGLETANGAARSLGPPVGGDRARPSTAKDRGKIDFDFVSKAGSKTLPI